MTRTLRPLAVLAMVALISAGCGSDAAFRDRHRERHWEREHRP